MDRDENLLKKIKVNKEKINSIDEQISELIVERFRRCDEISTEIFKNNLDIKEGSSQTFACLDSSQTADPVIRDILSYINEKHSDRYKFIHDKYNAKYACISTGTAYEMTRPIFADITSGHYYQFSINDEELPKIMDRNNFHGLIIGDPYKRKVIDFLDDVTDQVKEIEEVNLVQFYKNRRYGFNTEYFGILKTFERYQINLKNTRVLVLYHKESPKTVEYICKHKGAMSVQMVEINRFDDNNQYKADIMINSVLIEDENYDIDMDKIEGLKYFIDFSYRPYFSKMYLKAKLKDIVAIPAFYKVLSQNKKSLEILLRRRFEEKVFEEILTEYIKDNMNIVLVGMPGAGKTTIGRKLAKLSGRTHYDLDREFQNQYGISPADFLRNESEETFRRKEARVVERLSNLKGILISTSGGVVNLQENYYHLKKNSIIFRVDRDLHKLSTKNRPLSQGGMPTLMKMFDDRKEKYEQFTDYVVKNYGDFNGVAYKILEIFEEISIM